MHSRTDKIRRELFEAESRHIKQKAARGEGIDEKLSEVKLQEVPLEVRRKEAKQPLFLKRYE